LKLLITGSTGFLGSNLLTELENPNYKKKLGIETIKLLVRSKEKAKNIKSDLYTLEIIEGDLSNISALKKAAENVDAVIHIASKYAVKGRYRDFYTANVEGTKNLIDQLKPGTKFVLTSSVAVYGFNANKGRLFKEDFEPKKPFGPYQKTKKLQEDLAREMCKENGLFFVALRPPMISGRGDEPTRILLENIKKRVIMFGRGGKGLIPVMHPRDVAKLHLLALEKIEDVNGEAFHATSVHVPFEEYVNAYARAAGLKEIKLKVPYWFIYSIGAFMEFISFNTLDMNRFSVKMLGSSDHLDLTNVTEKLAFKPDYTLEEIVKEGAEWYKELEEKKKNK